MKITNMLHFTEQHRFCVYRDFALSGLGYRMLASVYQPMVGALSVGIYTTLYQQLQSEKAGFSPLEQQRKLFLSLELEPGDRGRKLFVEQTSKLEAVGLLQTTRRFVPSSEDYIYEYQLFHPLSPHEFFKNQHLTLLLRDKVGKYAVLFLKDELVAEEPGEFTDSNAENISVPFYDIFRLNTKVIDYELEQALFQASSARQAEASLDVTSKGFGYTDIIMRTPRGSRNRPYIEQLRVRPDQLTAVNMAAKKFGLTLQETCRLLDEDGVFDDEGELMFDKLQYQANLMFRHNRKRDEQVDRDLHRIQPPEREAKETAVEMDYYLEVPALFEGQCDVHQYNMLLRNEPYTAMLRRFFPKGAVPKSVLDSFERVDLHYKLPEEVTNVLIHFFHTDRYSWSAKAIETVVAEMLGAQIGTYEQAVEYVREKRRFRERQKAAKAGETNAAPAAGRGRGRQTQKPKIAIIGKDTGSAPSAETIEEMWRVVDKLDKTRSDGR